MALFGKLTNSVIIPVGFNFILGEPKNKILSVEEDGTGYEQTNYE
ncbi:hypothetical protein PSECIP111951_04146 [Pseudoalteromonas holothuriae]|uniref:Uncharacterized protein n=1 Tax=Pseudoalteromonas holothuriae TaxID=2963714 RepID=A0ABN8URY8_9GAMM|nr:hypothetical protein PSECIP111951_04146 [Pseudoalteromonas sp. CIP111951]